MINSVNSSNVLRLAASLFCAVVLYGLGPSASARIYASELGLIVNTADPYSVEIGKYYARKRGIPKANIVFVELPRKPVLSAGEFALFSSEIAQAMPSTIRAYAVAWTEPYAVECNSLTSALSWRFQPELCKQTCAASQPSPYFDANADMGVRPSMLLAATSILDGKRLIDRGVKSDANSNKALREPLQARFIRTNDAARNVRARLYPDESVTRNLEVKVVQSSPSEVDSPGQVIVYQTGAIRVEGINRLTFAPGALADHLTSFGGQLTAQGAQMSALAWLEAGATASYGTVTEPCNHLEKFPHPAVLLKHYRFGLTAVEAYWRSVAWPAQGVFIGEPLAAPFAAGLAKKR